MSYAKLAWRDCQKSSLFRLDRSHPAAYFIVME